MTFSVISVVDGKNFHKHFFCAVHRTGSNGMLCSGPKAGECYCGECMCNKDVGGVSCCCCCYCCCFCCCCCFRFSHHITHSCSIPISFIRTRVLCLGGCTYNVQFAIVVVCYKVHNQQLVTVNKLAVSIPTVICDVSKMVIYT